jgi:hypothetical protein
MPIDYEAEPLREIFQQNKSREFVLPNFQRDFVWKREDQVKLFASFMTNLPIGGILLVEGDRNKFAARELCYANQINPQEKCKFLLDGQQRMSCLNSIFNDLFAGGNWRENWNNLFSPLQNRWFIRIQPPSIKLEDIWGWKFLHFPKNIMYDPSEVEEFILCQRILVRDSDKPHHPAYEPLDPNGDKIIDEESKRLRLSRIFAEQSIVPLYELASDRGDNALHVITLRQIASNRRYELRSKVENSEIPVSKVFEHLEPGIEEIWQRRDEDNAKDRLNDLWSDLHTSWQKDVCSSLEGMLDQKILETVLPYKEISRATSVFETINKGGTPLSTFDLMVARLAMQDPDKSLTEKLRESFEKSIDIPIALCSEEVQWNSQNMQVMSGNTIIKIVQDHFLNLVSILCYSKKNDVGLENIKVEHIKQAKILELAPEDVISKIEVAAKALVRAYAFLQFRCGMLSIGNLNYRLMVIPIAYLLSNDEVWSDQRKLDKIEYWYWSSLFSGSYREKQNERTIQDLNLLDLWVVNNNEENPFKNRCKRVLDDSNYSDKQVLMLETPEYDPPAAIKSGILEYILSKSPRDFLTDSEEKLKSWEIASSGRKLEDHHLIPLGSATRIGQSSSELRRDRDYILNSPLNHTYISQEANRKIRDLSPEKYLQYLQSITLYGHSVPANFVDLYQQSPKGSDEDKYKRFLSMRFDEIKKDILTELDNLIS